MPQNTSPLRLSTALWRSGLIALITLAVAGACMTIAYCPFAFVFAALALGFLACCIWVPRPTVTYICLTLMAFWGTCAGMELYFYVTNDMNNSVFDGKYASVADPVLGYAPAAPPKEAGAAAEPVRSRRILRGEMLYDVVYTAGADGWRISPQHPQATRAALFFGCSYTMGEGVNDAESYPYIVGDLLGPQWQTYNFGFSGYGPHQFLALLESGRLDHIFKKYEHVDVFFMNIWGHEFRSGGYSVWDTHGPRYVLEHGKAVRRGDFSTPLEQGLFHQYIYTFKRALMQTHLCTKVLLRILRWNAEPLLNLQTAILVRAQEYLAKQYPNSTFTVIVYPTVIENLPRFAKAGLRTLDISPALHGWPNDALYRIKGDRHPTPLANTRTAQGIVQYMQQIQEKGP